MSEIQILPQNLPLFPLGGAILLPGEVLPLNVFEPRYLNMVDDVRREGGFIGIIQTRAGLDPAKPALAHIGGAGRLDEFRETDDGRYLIELTGVSRFRLETELDTETPYRMARADYQAFAADLEAAAPTGLDTSRLFTLLRLWFADEGLSADWDNLASAPSDRLINQLSMMAPFASTERQDLLEARELADRMATMERILTERIASGADGAPH